MARIQVNPLISLDEAELEEQFVQASGPGGQNVNKVATAVQLKLDVKNCDGIPETAKRKLALLAGRRLSSSGVLTLIAREHRSQQLNRQAARDRLFALLRQASRVSKPRVKTKPTRSSKIRRIEAKGRRSNVKKMRRRPPSDS